MTRQFASFRRLLLILGVTLVLGTAAAQAPLDAPPPAPDAAAPQSDAPALDQQTPPPTVEPMIPPDGSLGRFDPDSGAAPVAPLSNRDTVTRMTYDLNKLDGTLGEMLFSYVRGDTASSDLATRNYYLPQDKKGRFLVIVSAAPDVSGKRLEKSVRTAGGVVQYREGKRVFAKLTAFQMSALSLDPKIALIQPQSVGRADPEPTSAINNRTPAGDVYSEGFDVANALVWHTEGNEGGSSGSRINIGVIDFGFGGSTSAGTELACLNSYPSVTLTFGTLNASDTRRGLDMAEVMCDLAPGARIRLYKVATSDNLYDAINAADNVNDVIVIGADFGANFSPGDGGFGRASSKNVYQALATAKANGVTVIAAAGNTNGAYKAFTFTGTTTTVPLLKIRRGDTVNLSWNDWEANPNVSGGAQDDISATFSGSGFATQTKPARGGGIPAHQFVVPASCTLDVDDFCTGVSLTVNVGSGNASSLIVQVNIGGGLDREIGVISGSTALDTFGTLSRPADSADVIAVGAVCVDYTNNFPLEPYSANGPVYTPGGNLPATPPEIMTAFDVKPDVVGPANVSVAPNQISFPITCTEGLRGTQASAAHVGGMVALLLNNPLVEGFNGLGAPDAIAHYLRTHSIDLPLSPDAQGYDNTYGSGLPALGMPDFDYDKSLTAPLFAPPNRIPQDKCGGGVVYVGPRNAGNSVINPTQTDYPYQSIMQAAYAQNAAGVNRCVIVLPGEYVTPIMLGGMASETSIYGYIGVTLLGGVDPTTMAVQNKFWGVPDGIFQRRAAIYVDGGQGTTIGGINFEAGTVLSDAQFFRPQVLAVDSSDDFTFTRAEVAGILTNQTLLEIFRGSQNATISESTFSDNIGQAGAGIVGVYYSGSPAGRITIEGNTFENNVTNEGTWDIQTAPFTTIAMNWTSMIRSVESYTDIVSNVMVSNTAESLIEGATSTRDMPFELRILGNAIVDTTISSAEGFTAPGPLIHGFFQRYIMAVNNTIAGTTFLGSGFPWSTIFGRGNDIDGDGFFNCTNDCGTLYPDLARWDIRGNLIVNNNSSQIVAEMDSALDSGAGCVNFADQAEKGAQNNWIFGSGLEADCHGSLHDGATGNTLGINPLAAGIIQGGADATTPGYYAPVDVVGADLIDVGPDAFVTANLPAFSTGFDVRGDLRRNVTIDIGAYEFTAFFLEDPILRTSNEDAGVVEFDVNDPLFLDGGFPPFSATVISYPVFYGTQCDARFTSPATQGMAVEVVNASTLTIAYCPPRNFHTDTFFVGSGYVSATIQVTDAVGNTSQTELRYTINPVNDSPLVTVLGDNLPAEDVVKASVALGIGSASNTFRLRPYVDFANNFFFSESANPVLTARSEVDYDFAYPDLPELVSGSAAISGNLTWFDQQRGIVGVNLLGVSTPATATLSYEVTDDHGNTVTNFIVINAVEPPGPFTQSTPTANFVISNLDTFNAFTWTLSTHAVTYDVLIEKLVNGIFIPTLTLPDQTPLADADSLACAASCTFTLTAAQKQLFGSGSYRWTIHADNQGLKTRASNFNLPFSVNTGRELISNGGFETQGKNAKTALDWKLAKGTKDLRKCGALGFGGSPCMFEFTGNTTAATMTQKPAAIGRKGDKFTLSAAVQTSGLKANKGIIQLTVTYTTGDKEKFKITAPSGTTAFTTLLVPETTLRFPVASYVVTLQMKAGKGKMQVDNVSLILSEQLDFELLTPGDNNTTVADSAFLTTFTWQTSAAAASYTVDLIKTFGQVHVVNQSFTAAADTDPLTCAKGTCVFKPGIVLANGDYIWTVTASNGTVASNAPFNLTVDVASLVELVKNGSFELKTKKMPKNWKATGTKSAGLVCAAGTAHPEYQGLCAFQFVGASGLNARLSQTLVSTGLLANDRLTLRAAAFLSKSIAGATATLSITYTNNQTDSRKITLPGGSGLWVAYAADTLTLNTTVKKATVTLAYKGKSGKVIFDNVSVIKE